MWCIKVQSSDWGHWTQDVRGLLVLHSCRVWEHFIPSPLSPPVPHPTCLALKVKSLSHVQLCDPMGCSPPGSSSIHGIFQARILEWIAFFFSSGSAQPRDRHLLLAEPVLCTGSCSLFLQHFSPSRQTCLNVSHCKKIHWPPPPQSCWFLLILHLHSP